MKFKWRKIADGCWHCYRADDPGKNMVAECNQDDYGRKLWAAHTLNHGNVTCEFGYDRFLLAEAKTLAERRLRLAEAQRLAANGEPNPMFQVCTTNRKGEQRTTWFDVESSAHLYYDAVCTRPSLPSVSLINPEGTIVFETVGKK